MEEHIASLLLSTLSPEAHLRGQAESGLAEIQRNGEAGLALARICLAQNVDLALRQAAGINLKKYIREHWSVAFETFKGDPPNEETRDEIRQSVFAGLSDPARKIRLACAAVVSEIASSDWPDAWPTLLTSLVQLLESADQASVHGAMRVMIDFVGTDLSEDQLLPLANTILPQLLQILGAEGRYSAVTRSQSVVVFRQCLSTLYMVKESVPQASQYATTQVLPQWIAVFKQILSTEPCINGSWDSLYVRNEIFQTLSTILVSFPKTLSTHMADLVTAGLQHLTILMPAFRASHLNDDLDAVFSLSEADSDDLTIPRVSATILEYIASAARRPSGKALFVDSSAKQPSESLYHIVYLSCYYAQITTDDEDRWSSDVNAFVADEDEEIPASTLRTASLDLLSSFYNSFGAASTTEALKRALERVMQEASGLQSAGQADWWKGYEACLAHLSSAAEDLSEDYASATEAGRAPLLDLSWVFEHLVVPFIHRSDLPFLQGRALVFASTIARHLPPEIQEQFFQSSMQAFESQDISFIVKISALRALKNFCQQIPDSARFASLGNRLTENLIPLIPQASEATLVLLIETLQRTLSLNSIQHNQSLCKVLAGALVHPIESGQTKDPLLSSALGVLITTFSSSPLPSVHQSIVEILLPSLARLLTQPENDDTRPSITSAVTAIDNILDGRPTPLGERVFSTIGQPLFDLLSRTGDDSILQEGLECLTFVIRKDIGQLIDWKSTSGEPGLSCLFRVVGRVLDPECSESGGLFVGDLLLHVFRRAAEQILPILADLLRALVVRLSTALTATYSQSLILPFAYLIHTQKETVLQLLESVNVEGKTGVQIVLDRWCEYVETFQGFWNIRISTIALCRLLSSQKPSVTSLEVKGDLIVDETDSQVIMTRSRSRGKIQRFTQIPFKAKAVKIILKELEQSNEQKALQHQPVDLENDDDDASWDDEDDGIKGAVDLSDVLGGNENDFFGEGDQEDDDDEDLKNDPAYTLDLPPFIAETLKAFARDEPQTFEAYTSLLSASERHTLHSL